MTTPQLYYLLFVLLSFFGFGASLIFAYVRYRRWLAMQPHRPL